VILMDMFQGIGRDLAHAGRSLAKARAFTFVCVVSLGVGLAPVIAIPYGARIFKTPPPGVNTEGLVELVTTRVGPRGASDAWSYPDFLDLRDATTGMAMTGWASGDSRITTPASGGHPGSASTMFVSSNYFTTIGVALPRGPGFGGATEPVVIPGYSFWQNRLGADPDIVGTTLILDDVPHLVVGIGPEQFGGHLAFQQTDLFVPLEQHPLLRARESTAANARSDRGNEWVHIHGRLSPSVGLEQASAAVSAITTRLATQFPATNEFKAGTVEPYHPIGSLEGSDLVIVQAVWSTLTALPLLVVCLNISGMMQVRSAMRERELSIRQAIGASRGRLVQHLLAEAVLLAGLGGALVSLVLFNLPPVVSWWMAEPMPVQLQEALRVDLSMVAICVGLCLATSVGFGWLPATRFSRPVIISALKDDAGGGGLRVGRVHRRTAAVQVAIAVPLLVLSGISLDRVRATASADLGFESELLYAAPLDLDALAGENAGSRIRRVRDTLAEASGIASVTVADGLPLDFRYRIVRVSLQSDADVAPNLVSVHVTRVGDGYLDTMGIPLVRGRGFTDADRAGAEMVTIVSKSLTDQLFPAADAAEALGRRLTAESGEKRQQTLTIVGVTADFPTSQMSTERAQLLVPLAQHADLRGDSVPVRDDRGGAVNLMLIARSATGEQPMKVTAALETAVRELEPDFNARVTTSDGEAHSRIVTGVSLRQDSMSDFLSQSAVSGVIAAVLLMLAALGIYGVVGLMVAARTREVAVRIALGASRRRVVGMILFDVLKLVLPGIAAGLVITVAFVRLGGDNMGTPLSNLEPLAYIAGGAVAILVAVVASLVPARRAAGVDPAIALRAD